MPRPLPDPSAALRDATAALARSTELLSPGTRQGHRAALARAVELAQPALAADDESTVAAARAVLLRAHAALAADARHGAGQLSLGSQRAPTLADCEDGWRRVASIVAVAEASAAEARLLADRIDTKAARRIAQAAELHASEARRIVRERNPAYTFHTDPGFSFGEGWYVAAAAVLAGVAAQLEPEPLDRACAHQLRREQAERFLRDAGAGGLLQPYRSRPRANKQLTGIVADVFRADPAAAQRRLRAAFLGQGAVPGPLAAWTDRRMAAAPAGPKALIWIRTGTHHAHRNTDPAEVALLAARARSAGLGSVLVGDGLQGELPAGSVDLTLFWKDPLFQGLDQRRAQLQLFEHLRAAHGVVGQLGVTTAGMDGPALLGLPTMYLTERPNVRMRAWVGAVPGYEEIVRGPGWMERVDRELRRWAGQGGRAG